MVERTHNAASEFARAVRASGRQEHIKKLAGRYDTAVARALAALAIDQFNKVDLVKNWRRGHCQPRSWAVQIMRDKLEQEAELLYAIAEELRHEVGPGSPGQAGAAHWRRYWARKAAEKEKAAQKDGP